MWDALFPKNYTIQKITIRSDENILEKVDELANQLRISRNDLVNQCIEYALKQLDSNND